jgi:hypothetical protein
LKLPFENLPKLKIAGNTFKNSSYFPAMLCKMFVLFECKHTACEWDDEERYSFHHTLARVPLMRMYIAESGGKVEKAET